jgi:hypothetical protein
MNAPALLLRGLCVDAHRARCYNGALHRDTLKTKWEKSGQAIASRAQTWQHRP